MTQNIAGSAASLKQNVASKMGIGSVGTDKNSMTDASASAVLGFSLTQSDIVANPHVGKSIKKHFPLEEEWHDGKMLSFDGECHKAKCADDDEDELSDNELMTKCKLEGHHDDHHAIPTANTFALTANLVCNA